MDNSGYKTENAGLPSDEIVAISRLVDVGCAVMLNEQIRTSVLLGIPDLLASGPKHIAALAEQTNTRAPLLYRFLRSLASAGYFREVEPNTFVQSEYSAVLCSTHPSGARYLALLHGDTWQKESWNWLLYCLQTGDIAPLDYTYGKTLFEYLDDHPSSACIFNGAMTAFSNLSAPAILAAYDFSGIQDLVDVGGGLGSLLKHILAKHPMIHGTLVDRPEVIRRVRDQKLPANFSVIAGNFFDAQAIPPADAYLLRSIVRDFDLEHACAILQNCRRAMKSGGRVLIVEPVLRDGMFNEYLMDIQLMLVAKGACLRREDEYQALFQDTGLILANVYPTASPDSILECVVA